MDRRVLTAFGLAVGLLAGISGSPVFGQPCPDGTTTRLIHGVTVSALALDSSCDPGLRFRLEVPEGASALSVTTSGGSGDVTLLARFAANVDPASPVHLSAAPGNEEAVFVPLPNPGNWFFELRAEASFAGVQLTADFSLEEEIVFAGTPRQGLADTDPSRPRFRYFTVEVPAGSTQLDVSTHGGSGDVDLFVRRRSFPDDEVFDFASKLAGNEEGVCIGSPIGGTWKIGLLRNEPYSGVDLDVSITPGGACQPTPTTLCLLNARFQANVHWKNHRNGQEGFGLVIAHTDRNGVFVFFKPDVPELVFKMLDGRVVNGHFWAFWGGLTDLEYDIRVTDTETGAMQTFHHPASSFEGGGDTTAFE